MLFLDSLARFEPFLDKVRHITSHSPITGPFRAGEWDAISWANEVNQRNALTKPLDDCRPSDLVLVSDVDEIPSLESIMRLPDDNIHRRLRHDCYHFNFNWLDTEGLDYTMDTGAIRFRNMRNPCDIRTFAPIWEVRSGWHFTWFGGQTKVDQKKAWYNHTLRGQEQKRQILQSGRALTPSRDVRRLPRWVQDNLPRFSHLFEPDFVARNVALFRPRP